MFRFIARRILETIPVLFVIATATFFMMRLAPGGPFASEKQASKEVRARMDAHYGLDKPPRPTIYTPYLQWARDRMALAVKTTMDSRGMIDAVKNAVKHAHKTAKNLRWFQVVDTRGDIIKGRVSHWQVTIKVGFSVEG